MHNSLLAVPVKDLWATGGVMGFVLGIVARMALFLMKATGMARQLKTIPMAERRPNTTWVNQSDVKTYVLMSHGLTPVCRCPARGEDGWSYMVSQLS